MLRRDGERKYLGMTWNRKENRNMIRFRLNLHKKFHGIPSGEDLDSPIPQDRSISITKKNMLSVACQFYNPAGLAGLIMFFIRSLFSKICRDHKISMQTDISQERADKFRLEVEEVLKTKDLSLPCQAIFNGQGQLYVYFDGSLQCYGACIYVLYLG